MTESGTSDVHYGRDRTRVSGRVIVTIDPIPWHDDIDGREGTHAPIGVPEIVDTHRPLRSSVDHLEVWEPAPGEHAADFGDVGSSNRGGMIGADRDDTISEIELES